MMNLFRDFVKDERGEDIIEHTFAVAFAVLLVVVLLHGAGSAMVTNWAGGQAVLSAANTAAG
ncbi:MAG TPA: hypothetical protein VGZ73_16720 [Bryobacteraceae bacterium]|jgi:Flp pilus assembly pilin Flp|nr:hypothetical protein [Bryobacteraceae bacterium]